jgi:hypothetical protein
LAFLQVSHADHPNGHARRASEQQSSRAAEGAARFPGCAVPQMLCCALVEVPPHESQGGTGAERCSVIGIRSLGDDSLRVNLGRW